MNTAAKLKYQSDYAELPFENILREYRKQNILNILKAHQHNCILEIGSGPEPFFCDFDEYKKMVVVEPGINYYNTAKALAATNSRVQLINDCIENLQLTLENEVFDFIIIGGFLHEIGNPDEVLQVVKKLCSPRTMVHTFVPNANSFHRLIAYEMKMTKNVYEKSGHDELFQRFKVYDIPSIKQLLAQNGFLVKDCSTYFIKPFTHSQLQQMLDTKIIDKTVIDGLNSVTKYFPDNGAEISINCIPVF